MTSIPDRSQTRSPTGSIRTIRSELSTSSVGSGSGSRSTVFVPPLDSIPDLPDFPDFTTLGSQSATDAPTASRTLTRTGLDTLTQTFSPQGTYSSLSSFGTRAGTRATDDGALSSGSAYLHPLSYEGRGIQIAPSRSSSLRRTSSLTDLDKEFAGVVGSIIGSESERAERRDRRRAISSYYTPTERSGGDEDLESQSALSVSISDMARSGMGRGATRRVAASTYYSLSSLGPNDSASNISYTSAHSRPTSQTGLDNSAATGPSGLTGSGTQIVTSSLSLRRTESNSLLGDSHSGPTTPTRVTSPHTSSYSDSDGFTSISRRSPETLLSSGGGLSRRSEVRRRTPRTASRTYTSLSRSAGETTPSESDKENETTEVSQTTATNGETVKTDSWDACNTSCWSSMDSGSYTRSSYSYSYSGASRTPSTAPKSLPESSIESETDDVFLTPSTRSSYYTARSPTPTPAPSTPTSSASFFTADKAPSTSYETAEGAPSEPSTEFITAEVCPSTPPSTEYDTAECRCQLSETEEEEEPEEEPVETPKHEPVEELEDEPVEEPTEEPTEESVGEPVEEPEEVEEEELPIELTEEEDLVEEVEEMSVEPESSIPSEVTPDSPVVIEPSVETEESIPEEISTLTRSPSISMQSETPSIRDEDAASLYAPSIVPTIPDELEYAAALPLPPSTVESRSLLSSPRTEEVPPSSPGPSTPSTVSTPFILEDLPRESTVEPESETESTLTVEPRSLTVPPTPVVESPSGPSLLSSVSSTSTESESTPTPSSISSPSSDHISIPSQTPPPSSILARSVPSRTDGYDSSFLMPSPSMHSTMLPAEPIDKSFETSFLRPSMSDVPTEDLPVPPPPKSEAESTSTPTLESTATISSFPRTMTVSLSRSPSSVSAVSAFSMSSSVFYPRSIYDEEEEEESKYLPSPATLPTLLSSKRSRTPSSDRTVSPPTVPTLLTSREETPRMVCIYFIYCTKLFTEHLRRSRLSSTLRRQSRQ